MDIQQNNVAVLHFNLVNQDGSTIFIRKTKLATFNLINPSAASVPITDIGFDATLNQCWIRIPKASNATTGQYYGVLNIVDDDWGTYTTSKIKVYSVVSDADDDTKSVVFTATCIATQITNPSGGNSPYYDTTTGTWWQYSDALKAFEDTGVGANATFKGVATPSTAPGTPDGPIFYFAVEKGVYSNFGGQSVSDSDGLVVFLYSSVWEKYNLPIATKTELVQLASDVSQITKAQAIQILKQYDSTLIFKGFAAVGDATPAATLNHAYIVKETGTVFGVAATEGQVLVGDGTVFGVRNVSEGINKNSFNLQWTQGIRLSAIGVEETQSLYFASGYYPVYAASEIWFEGITQDAYSFCSAFDVNKKFISNIVEKTGTGGRVETMPENAAFIRICHRGSTVNSVNVKYYNSRIDKTEFKNQLSQSFFGTYIDLTSQTFNNLYEVISGLDSDYFPSNTIIAFKTQNGNIQKYHFNGENGVNYPWNWKPDTNNSVKEFYAKPYSATLDTDGTGVSFILEFPHTINKAGFAYIVRGASYNVIRTHDETLKLIDYYGYQSAAYTSVKISQDTKFIEVFGTNDTNISKTLIVYTTVEPTEKNNIRTANLLDKNDFRKGEITSVDEINRTFEVVYYSKRLSSKYIAVEPENLYVFAQKYSNTFNNPFWFIFFDENKNVISINDLQPEAKVIDAGWNGFYVNTPPDCKYIMFSLVNWDTVYDNFLAIDFVFCKYNDIQEAIYGSQQNEINYSDIKKSYHKYTSNLSIWILGDSISASGYGAAARPPKTFPITNPGGWTKEFISKIRPRKWYNHAAGGHTISEKDYTWVNGSLQTTGNSYVKRLEDAILNYNNGDIEAPDWLFIVGCTNDMDASPRRYVELSELGAKTYEDYMEETFMTNNATTYDATIIKDIQTVPLVKIAGAIRYIIQRVGTLFPNCKFVIVTPTQDTKHTLKGQKNSVAEMKWIANRLSIPVIDVWGRSLCMLWDYNDGTTYHHRHLPDGIHPFSESGITEGANIQGRFIANEFLNILYR